MSTDLTTSIEKYLDEHYKWEDGKYWYLADIVQSFFEHQGADSIKRDKHGQVFSIVQKILEEEYPMAYIETMGEYAVLNYTRLDQKVETTDEER